MAYPHRRSELSEREAVVLIGVVFLILGIPLVLYTISNNPDWTGERGLAASNHAPIADLPVQPLPDASVPVAPVAALPPPPPSSMTPDDVYDRDVSNIVDKVLSDTLRPSTATFTPRWEVLPNRRGNSIYVGWYSSEDLRGRRGNDSIIAEVTPSGQVLSVRIGDFENANGKVRTQSVPPGVLSQ